MKKDKITASQLVAILQKRIEEFGDLVVSVNTQDGGSYYLYGPEDVSLVTWTDKSNGTQVSTLEIC